jgi:hypothetical protein
LHEWGLVHNISDSRPNHLIACGKKFANVN